MFGGQLIYMLSPAAVYRRGFCLALDCLRLQHARLNWRYGGFRQGRMVHPPRIGAAFKNDRLPVVIGRNIRPGCRGDESLAFNCAVGRARLVP